MPLIEILIGSSNKSVKHTVHVNVVTESTSEVLIRLTKLKSSVRILSAVQCTPANITSSKVSVVSEAAAATHLGCYDEFGTEEVFVRATKVRITELSSLTPDGCREKCRENLIYSYAALWVCILFHFYNTYQRYANKNLKLFKSTV